MKLLREAIRRLILEHDNDMIEHINSIIDDYKLNEDNLDFNRWNQLDALIDDMFPSTKPPNMKIWFAGHPLNGEAFESYITQEEAMTAHLRDESIVPANNDGIPVDVSEILDWDPNGYAYVRRRE